MRIRLLVVGTLAMLLFASGSSAQLPKATPYPGPDDRYKADVLLVVGHPDDDALISAYLAKLSFDEHKRIAAIVCTQGDGGGNAIAAEAGAALGQVRVQEARRALDSLGIVNVWFLGNHDTPAQNVLWSLDRWNHGRTLDEMVRLVRLTRPEIIVTMLPDQVAGENHADHQAAGVIATEAFDLAGNPTVFPEQVSAPRELQGMSNLTEGLQPWQPKKIYYITDAFENYSQYWHDAKADSPYRANFLKGAGPEYATTGISPSRHISYGQIAAEEQVFYMTQEGNLGKESIAKGDYGEFEQPVRFIFGKSVVKPSRRNRRSFRRHPAGRRRIRAGARLPTAESRRVDARDRRSLGVLSKILEGSRHRTSGAAFAHPGIGYRLGRNDSRSVADLQRDCESTNCEPDRGITEGLEREIRLGTIFGSQGRNVSRTIGSDGSRLW